MELLSDSLSGAQRDRDMRPVDMISTATSSITAATHLIAHSADSTNDVAKGTKRLNAKLASDLDNILYKIPPLMLNYSAVGEVSSAGSNSDAVGKHEQSIHVVCKRIFSNDLASTTLSAPPSIATVEFPQQETNSSILGVALIAVGGDPLYPISKNETSKFGGASIVQIHGHNTNISYPHDSGARDFLGKGASLLFTVPVGAGGVVNSSNPFEPRGLVWNGSNWQSKGVEIRRSNGSMTVYATRSISPQRATFSNAWIRLEVNISWNLLPAILYRLLKLLRGRSDKSNQREFLTKS